MNYDRLKTFIAVAEKKSFSEAAKILYVTQPTITAQVKALEEELNTKLFERTTKKVEMTQSAAILLKYAREIVRLNDSAKKEIFEIEEALYGDLHIGCSLTIGEYVLPEFLKRLKEAYPLINISVEITNSNNIVQQMKDQQIDIGLVETPVDEPQIIMEPFLEDELLLIAAPDYFGENEIKISSELLRSTPLIMRERGSGTRAVVTKYLDEAGIAAGDLNIVMELGSTEAIKSAVEAGLGVSVISRHAIRKEQKLKSLKAYAISNMTFSRYFYIAFRKNQVLKSTTDVFVEELKKAEQRKEENMLIHLPTSNC